MWSPQLAWKESLPTADDGPHGFLVREVILHPGDLPIYPYMRAPEYVSNLCSAIPHIGDELHEAYRQRSTPAIVQFRSSEHMRGTVGCALVYATAKLRGQPLNQECNMGFSGRGITIPFRDVLSVEWLGDVTA
jgi:hypothetical protein